MRAWSADRLDDIDGELAASAETFMSWKVGYDDGDLGDVTVAGAEDYLLEWCPRKVSVEPDGARDLCRGLSAYVEFMNATGRLRGGVGRAAEVMTAVADLEDDAVAAMGDRSKFGLGKSVLTAPLMGGDGSPLPDLDALLGADGADPADLQRLLDERMEAFNALPFEERKALTEGAFAPVEPPRVELAWTLVGPSTAEVETSIERHARLVTMVLGLVDWLGEKGRPTTAKGNFTLADARQLVELLATGDEFDPTFPWKQTTRSSEELPTLTLVADVALECGAVRLVGAKMLAEPAWSVQPLVDRATSVVGTLLELGPLTMTGRGGILLDLGELFDDGVPHWLTGALPVGEERELDEVVEFASMVADQSLRHAVDQWSDEAWAGLVHDEVHRLFDLLSLAGLVEIRDRGEQPRQYGGLRKVGGVFSATAFARHVMPPFVRAAGYDFTYVPDLTTATAAELVAVVADGDLSGADVTAAWWPDRSVAERAEALAAVAGEGTPGERVAAFGIFEELDDAAAVGPAVRSLLDTPASAHAALFLIDHGLASHDELGGFLTLGPLVDALSELIDLPDVLAEMFAELDAASGGDVLEDLWRHDQPETLELLLALGRHLPDKRKAKAARTAANKHRSWIANRHR
jgi:hypothetical protein